MMYIKSLILFFVPFLLQVPVYAQDANQAALPSRQEIRGAESRNQAAETKTHKIVFQLSSSDTLVWKGLINNLKNLKEGWGDAVEMAIIAHGPGIEFLMKQKTTQHTAIKRLQPKGIEFIACENTMKNKNITATEIIPEATFVVMGIGEIVERQEKGWTYIKAGF